jgi:hypothetical protein
MPRKTRKKEEALEQIKRRINIHLPTKMMAFLELEAKRYTEARKKRKKGDRIFVPSDIVRALIVAYYEKRIAGLLVGPDD